MRSHIRLLSSGLLLVAAAGCQTSKSSSPTAPTVAGPIAGVTISAPVLLQPAQGFKFKESEQPIQLVIQNATTNGVRALTYTFEVATDSAFTAKVFSRSKVAPGDNNQTTASLTPTLVAANAATVGPVNNLTYEFQIATDQAFGHMATSALSAEG